jgi:acylphosphatase
MASTQIFRRYLVAGRVQGVGFRWFVEREAKLIGVTGWVRNRDDCGVEVLAAGTNAQLGMLYEKLKEGPRAARIDEVEVEDAAPFSGYKTFQIEESR